jgi:hypothetical protein
MLVSEGSYLAFLSALSGATRSERGGSAVGCAVWAAVLSAVLMAFVVGVMIFVLFTSRADVAQNQPAKEAASMVLLAELVVLVPLVVYAYAVSYVRDVLQHGDA